MLHLVHQSLASPNLALPSVVVRTDRLQLAKRLWRGVADDGAEFGFELETPLKPGQTVFENESVRYVLEQSPEPVLEISLELPPSAAAGIGWAVGNLHLELSAEPTRLLTPDDSAARQLLNRIGIAFRETTAVFRPGRFARSKPTDTAEHAIDAVQNLGASHRHEMK